MTTNKINILTDDVIGKISAGEVVERPASVVKELVENSIDAGADSIEIEIKSAGHSLIRVADNGEGMSIDDAKLASRRYTTSKIRDINDLADINTLGFRGEALSSIAAVSQMDIITCQKNEKSGVYLYIESGEILKTRPAGRVNGTTVEVRNLFYNVPARRKFLKKESTELAEIVNVAGRFILSYPGIGFTLTHDGKRFLDAGKNMSMERRLKVACGSDIAGCMVNIPELAESGYEVKGYISRPSNTRKDKRFQLFFINGRFVRNALLSDAVYFSYKSLLERGRYPAVILFLKVPPGNIDVNVHPAKLEVKFSDEKTVRNIVERAIKSKFEEIKTESMMPASSRIFNPFLETKEEKRERLFSAETETQTEFSYGISGEKEPLILSGTERIFQISASYIVQIKGESVLIVDQHAAHERILYEFFSKASSDNPSEVQNLLFPARLDLSTGESIIMEKLAENFRSFGFHIEPFGEKSFIIQAVPAVLEDRDVKTVICDILGDFSSYNNLSEIDLREELIKLTACRSAIKAGDKLSLKEMLSLLAHLAECSLPFTCPHGRPTMLEITVEEIEKRFRRT